jgi:cobalt/nickel transport system permease protein
MQPLLAVHISDNLLTTWWWLGGFMLMTALMCLGALRVRDEEIPRIALLTSAFFIASLIHVRVGPTSAHLLLNGLVGVVLGWRACIAIPVAVFLQAVLFSHGGFTTIGINSCIMIIPALAAGGLFQLLQRVPWIWQPWFRSGLVACSCLTFMASLIFSICLVSALPGNTSGTDGLAAIYAALKTAREIVFHPLTLLFALVGSLAAVAAERKLETAPEFPLGLLMGEMTVLATVALNCLVLLAGGETNWMLPASILVIVHLPVAVVEGLVLGFAVGLLARVRPDIIGMRTRTRSSALRTEYASHREQPSHSAPSAAESQGGEAIRNLQSAICNQKHILALLLIVLVPSGPAWAHRLRGEYKVLPGQRVRVEAWFDLTAASPAGAIVQAIRENGEVLAEGKLNEKGTFFFSYPRAEALRIVISAGAGHREELRVSAHELKTELADPASGGSELPQSDRRFSDESAPAERRPEIAKLILKAALGIGVVMALALFALAWRRRLTSA